MKTVLVILFVAAIVGVGCQPANVTSVMSSSRVSHNNVQTRCEYLDMRSNEQMSVVFKKYDGWKLVYVSEYTTDKLFGTSGTVCFERSNNGMSQ